MHFSEQVDSLLFLRTNCFETQRTEICTNRSTFHRQNLRISKNENVRSESSEYNDVKPKFHMESSYVRCNQ